MVHFQWAELGKEQCTQWNLALGLFSQGIVRIKFPTMGPRKGGWIAGGHILCSPAFITHELRDPVLSLLKHRTMMGSLLHESENPIRKVPCFIERNTG